MQMVVEHCTAQFDCSGSAVFGVRAAVVASLLDAAFPAKRRGGEGAKEYRYTLEELGLHSVQAVL